MKALCLMLLFIVFSAQAALERTVIIKGVIGSSFDDEKIKIKDHCKKYLMHISD